jgi:hypothetical protein
MLEEVDAGVEWRPAGPVALGGEATAYAIQGVFVP